MPGLNSVMSRSKHQTLKSVRDGQSQSQISAMFAEGDADATEWVEKGRIKRNVRKSRMAAKLERPNEE